MRQLEPVKENQRRLIAPIVIHQLVAFQSLPKIWSDIGYLFLAIIILAVAAEEVLFIVQNTCTGHKRLRACGEKRKLIISTRE